MNVSKLDAMRKADKDREIELCQTIIDACETLGQIAQERGDGEYEMHWSRISGMALDGPKTDEQQKSFEEAARPLIKWLCENVHPHHSVIVTPTNAELLECLFSTGQVLDYVCD